MAGGMTDADQASGRVMLREFRESPEITWCVEESCQYAMPLSNYSTSLIYNGLLLGEQ